jgi:hypothetical protein
LVLGSPEIDVAQSHPPRVASFGALVVALLSTPLMMVQMALLQAVSGDSQGLPTNRSFAAVILIYGAIILFGFSKRSQVCNRVP